ncbi:hypothetical protein F511_34221 [Dorcoceras hygrometricum]|uniref:Uncharacterized protein n=1 Tax=Dorcoceras hygrometricum TaxID=472368 RepID=A0A2Z7AW05_9LAMI|nr:hypothetical protein F511_34221 [Dorcoceras hygrometricum]
MVIGSLATLDLPMVIDLIGIYALKGPYCTLTMTNWFLQALSVIPRGSWGDVARRFTMIRWTSPKMWFRSRNCCGHTASCIPEPLRVTQGCMTHLASHKTLDTSRPPPLPLLFGHHPLRRPPPAAVHRPLLWLDLFRPPRRGNSVRDKFVTFSSTDLRRSRDSSRGPDSKNDDRQPLKCQFPREIGRSQAPRRQQVLYSAVGSCCMVYVHQLLYCLSSAVAFVYDSAIAFVCVQLLSVVV